VITTFGTATFVRRVLCRIDMAHALTAELGIVGCLLRRWAKAATQTTYTNLGDKVVFLGYSCHPTKYNGCEPHQREVLFRTYGGYGEHPCRRITMQNLCFIGSVLSTCHDYINKVLLWPRLSSLYCRIHLFSSS
jgi:hypothetical protein